MDDLPQNNQTNPSQPPVKPAPVTGLKSSLIAEVKDAICIVKMDKQKMIAVSTREKATIFGFAFFGVPLVLNLILGSFGFPSGFGAIFSSFLFWPISIPVIALLGVVFLMSIIAKSLFDGKGDHLQFFRPVAYSGVLLIVSVIPFLLSAFGVMHPYSIYNLIWLAQAALVFVVSYFMLIEHHKIDKKDVVIVLIVGVVGYFLLGGVLSSLLIGGGFYGYF